MTRGVRFSTLSIAHFRGISEPLVFDLSAPLTLVFAPNGTGKTTMCDAAEWLLTGQVERLKEGKDFDASVLRSKFAKEDNPPSAAAEMIVGGKPRFLARVADGSQSPAVCGESSASAAKCGPHELLTLLAPAAAADEVHHLTAINLRQRWLKGTRFLSAEALAALIDTDDETIERRTQVFADLLGIRHLLDAERQCAKYASELSVRLRTLTQMIDQQTSEAEGLEEALAKSDATARSNSISARSEAEEAAALLEMETPEQEYEFDALLESLTAVHQRLRHELDERKSTVEQVEGQWSARISLERAVSEGAALESRLAASLADIEEKSREAASLVAQRISERHATDEAVRELAAARNRLTQLGANLLACLNDTGLLAAGPKSLVALSNVHVESRWTAGARNKRRRQLAALQASIEQSAGADERLRFIDANLAKIGASLVSEEALATLRSNAAEADARERAARSRLDATADPIARLQSAAHDLLAHDRGHDATKCPVCAHDWGESDRLRAAIESAVAAAPAISELARAEASVASETARAARDKLNAAVSTRTEAAALEKERAGLVEAAEQRRREVERLGLAPTEPLQAIASALVRLDVSDALATLLMARDELTPALYGAPTPLFELDIALTGLLDEIEATIASREALIQLQLANLVKAIESATNARDQLRANNAAIKQKLHECREELRDKATELASLRALWDSVAPNTDWSDNALAALKKHFAERDRRLSRAEGHIEAARAAWISETRRSRLNELRGALKPSLERRERMTARIAAANRARAVFHDAHATTSRRQVQGLSRVVNPLFARMHANRVFDRIDLGNDDDFLHWLADAGGQQLDPGKDFSQGQRQDLALALFLARARSLGGTFFLDEPVIHLDDLNRVGLLDIFRATALEGSQSLNLVITTSSRSLARHLIEKFVGIGTVDGPSGPVDPLKVIELDGNGRSGVELKIGYPLH